MGPRYPNGGYFRYYSSRDQVLDMARLPRVGPYGRAKTDARDAPPRAQRVTRPPHRHEPARLDGFERFGH